MVDCYGLGFKYNVFCRGQDRNVSCAIISSQLNAIRNIKYYNYNILEATDIVYHVTQLTRNMIVLQKILNQEM